MVKLVLPEPLVSLETAVLRAAVDSRAPLDRREARDSRDSLVSLELRGPLEQRDRRVKLDLRDQQVNTASLFARSYCRCFGMSRYTVSVPTLDIPVIIILSAGVHMQIEVGLIV